MRGVEQGRRTEVQGRLQAQITRKIVELTSPTPTRPRKMAALVDQKNIDPVVCCSFFCIIWLLFTLIQETSDHPLSWTLPSTGVVSMLQALASFESLFLYCFFASFLFLTKKLLLY